MTGRSLFTKGGAPAALGAVALSAFGALATHGWLGDAAEDVADRLRDVPVRNGTTDAFQRVRGYYEDLNKTEFDLKRIYAKVPSEQNWIPFPRSEATIQTNDYRRYELRGDADVVFSNARLVTNRWGMRSREVDKARSPNSFRAAVLGACTTMGWGVAPSAGFIDILERRLNGERAGKPFDRYELLNFAVGGYLTPKMVTHMTKKDIFSFSPDAVILSVTPFELQLLPKYLGLLLALPERPADMPDFLVQALATSGGGPEISPSENARIGQRIAKDVVRASYRAIVDASRAHGAVPIWFYVAEPLEPFVQSVDRVTLRQLAEEAGFVIVDLGDPWTTLHDRRTLLVDLRLDDHPNAVAHREMADRLFDALVDGPSTSIPALLSSRNQPLSTSTAIVEPKSNNHE